MSQSQELYLFVKRASDRMRRPMSAIAADMGLTGSGFLRGLRGRYLSADTCFRLAEVLGEKPVRILELAGKRDLHTMIERHYGKARAPRQLIDEQFAALPYDVKANIMSLVNRLKK